jgi:MYXO-CTERM domain-containing protein
MQRNQLSRPKLGVAGAALALLVTSLSGGAAANDAGAPDGGSLPDAGAGGSGGAGGAGGAAGGVPTGLQPTVYTSNLGCESGRAPPGDGAWAVGALVLAAAASWRRRVWR